MNFTKKPYLSICIPTYERLEIMQNTLTSIYADLENVSLDDFEVVISDNSSNQSTKKIIQMFNYSNLKYISTDCEGFLNSYSALNAGMGQFLKLHNNYTQFRKGTLRRMIEEIKNNSEKKPVIFYTNGLKLLGRIVTFQKFNDFMFCLSYFSSWSSGFGIWAEDFNKCKAIKIDKMFPQTSLLLEQNYKNSYLINDLPIFENQNIPKKGGYNIFKVFSVDFISLIYNSYLNTSITRKTYCKIKRDLLYNYLSVRYFKTVIGRLDKFESDKIKQNMSVYYSVHAYYFMILVALLSPIKHVYRKITISILKKKSDL